MSWKRTSGVKSRIDFGLSSTKPIRISLLNILLVLAGLTFNSRGQILTNFWSFTGGGDGSNPVDLVQGGDGNFYGVTYLGGASNINISGGQGSGTVFRISPSGNFTNLHFFNGSDGGNPGAGLLRGRDGNFYGTTLYGGESGNGIVFRISPNGSFTNLHSFNGGGGANPYAGLVEGSPSNFYGTTAYGGNTNLNFGDGYGTVFRISPGVGFTNLYSFRGNDGDGPFAGLVEGNDGNFYGTTVAGGASTNCLGGCGTVFRIGSSGNLTSLYSFTGGSDGANPWARLVQGSDGNFYGTTVSGGEDRKSTRL